MDESGSDESEDESVSSIENSRDEQQYLRKELADVPLGEIQKLKETVGLKKYNEAIFGLSKINRSIEDDDEESDAERKIEKKVSKSKIEKVVKKKSEPEEMTSKKRIFKPRNVVEDNKKKSRDPRFDNLSGKLNEDLFQKSYSFVDDMKKEEMKSVKKQFKKVRGTERKTALHKLLQRMEQQEKIKIADMKIKEKERKRKKEEYAAGKAGKKTFHLKKSDARKLEMAEKYRQLEKSGQLDKYMSKKRKHNASKEKKKLPPIK